MTRLRSQLPLAGRDNRLKKDWGGLALALFAALSSAYKGDVGSLPVRIWILIGICLTAPS